MVLQTPQEFERIKRILMTPDLVQHELCGSVNSEYTIASTSGLLDIRTDKWATGLASDLDIPTSLLPPVIAPGTVRGPLLPPVAKEVGMPNAICIASASHDTAAAVVATPFVARGAGFISSGTWSLVGVEIDTPVINDTTREGDLTNEGGYGNKVRLLRNVMGLWLLQECRRDWQQRGETYTYAELVTAAAGAEPWRTFIHTDDPGFISAGEMINRIQDFARKTNQSVPETLGQVARCVLESLALQYANTFDLLESCSGLPMPAVHIVGGGSKNELLCQLTADVSGREVIAGPVEATTMGNAIVQWISLGTISGVAEARELVKHSSDFKRYQPSSDANVRKIRERYNQIIELSKKMRG
jgi:rhamnulokinase